MLKRIAVILVWVVATVGTASLTYGAVTAAGRGIEDRPGVPVASQDIAVRLTTTTVDISSPPTTMASTTTDAPPTTAPATTVTSPSTSAPTTTATTATSAGTTTAAFTDFRTTPGGTVGVRVDGATVTLISVQPAPGFSQKIKDQGPEKVDVEFESETAEYRIVAEVEHGSLEWKVEVDD